MGRATIDQSDMRTLSVLVVAAACALCLSAQVDPALDAQCQDWVISNLKDMIILNQVAAKSHISTCTQYCMVAGSGFRADTTTCRHLCELSGGYNKFSHALSIKGGLASPDDICAAMFAPAIEEQAVSMLEVAQTQERKLGVRGDMTVQGTLSTSVLTSPIGDVKVSGELNVLNAIEAASARAAFLKSTSGVSIKQGIISKKDQLIVKGKIDADSVTASGDLKASFLEIDGVRQWSLSSLEDFEETGTDGWSHGEMTECAGRRILGGHCVEKAIPDLSKTFENLPPHTQVRITAKYYFIDSWDGESGYLRADGNTIWLDTYNHSSGELTHGINLCGNSTPERKFGTPIDVTMPHTGSSLTLTFGATTDEHSCDESFGIDSVMIFTR
eukprot:c15848_g1_i1.p1 GENE.c15848_g1_i1~~c15848_g1_i1.p1  ORF type:complete len:386 (-),score=89.84 c15848_g1_i1:33-1190(-)